MEVKDALFSYFADCDCRGLSDNATRVYQQRLRDFATFVTRRGIHHIEELAADHLRAFIAELRQRDAHELTNHRRRGKPLSSMTIFHYARIIKSFGNWLSDQELLPKNPFGKVKLPRKEQKLVSPLTLEQMVGMDQAIRETGGERTNRDLALYSFMVESGTRVDEVAHLTLDRLDLAGLTARVMGKGSKERLVYFTKVSAGRLQTYFKERPKVAAREVFLNLQTGRPLTANGIGQLIRRYGRRAGFHCHPHMLRHTFTTRLLINGEEKNLISVQKLLGHADLTMVLQYAHLLPVDAESQYRKFAPLTGLNLDQATPPDLAGDSCGTPPILAPLYDRLTSLLGELDSTLSALRAAGAETPPELNDVEQRLVSTLGRAGRG